MLQRYGQGPEDELTLESNGDYTREFGIPIDGTPEEREHAFWVSVDHLYFEISKQLEGLVLEGCINSTTCLSETPKVTIVQRGTSASISLSNAAYRSFIYKKFNVSPVDMESASVALICLQQRKPFVAFRAISGSPDRGSADSNDHDDTFISLAANNSVTVNLLSNNSTLSTSFAHIS
nr:bark storage protein a [Quercus suber]